MLIIVVKNALSIIAFTLVVLHVLFPLYKIDAVTIGLLVVASLPWMSSFLDSFKAPGGWEVKFRDVQLLEEKAGKVGLIANEQAEPIRFQYSFQMVASEDPNLALSGLRIEIERRLREMSQAAGMEHTNRGVEALLRGLYRAELLSSEDTSILSELLSTLNGAAHGASVDPLAAEWAVEVGPRLLEALDDRKPILQPV